MVSTYTPNINLEEPARGDQVGVWDVPVNSNSTLLDLSIGGIATISLNNSPIVLSAAQFQARQITFNSTLTGSCAITFPSTFTKSYDIQNLCSGSSAFVVTLNTTVAGGQAICCPPGETIEVFNDGSNLKYRNLDRIGTYWDYAGSSVPAWVSGCTVAPYLNCDGTAFSSATFPQLAVILGGNTLPNSKGRTRFALDQGAGLISTAATGFSSATVGSVGGAQTTTIGTSNLPPYTPSGTIASSVTLAGIAAITFTAVFNGGGGGVSVYAPGGGSGTVPIVSNDTFIGSSQGGVSAPLTNLPPAYIGGITMIRSA